MTLLAYLRRLDAQACAAAADNASQPLIPEQYVLDNRADAIQATGLPLDVLAERLHERLEEG